MLTRQFPGAARKQQKPYGVREAERETVKGRNARYQKTANARRNMRGTKPDRCPDNRPKTHRATRRSEQADPTKQTSPAERDGEPA